MSLHVPAGACIPVASASSIHVFPILKHCGAHKHIIQYIYYSMAESVIWQDIAQVGKVFS